MRIQPKTDVEVILHGCAARLVLVDVAPRICRDARCTDYATNWQLRISGSTIAGDVHGGVKDRLKFPRRMARMTGQDRGGWLEEGGGKQSLRAFGEEVGHRRLVVGAGLLLTQWSRSIDQDSSVQIGRGFLALC
jgi:hypothetical protein